MTGGRALRGLLTVLLVGVALVLQCTPAGPTVVPVTAVAYPNDPTPAPPACPDTHPLHDGLATPVLRVAAATDLTPSPVPDARAVPCGTPTGPRVPVSSSPPDAPGGAVLCTEICVSRR
ncbi:hypothetical protein [Pseudonocardia sp. WMMC193]|uniref:hypothetical protein n=1 Tax=Pseudonocardia sp. WMMC193 TaxID=2911965 RepID=UPI001F3BF554|nr:hypothetical protein [Pseudonocardia sp. WMMC193]MCF7549460.1 hypothetical protein [Pseudonocardia sp. WMMC193]